jgi:RNA polymerase sigma factor (sigma-70 family)
MRPKSPLEGPAETSREPGRVSLQAIALAYKAYRAELRRFLSRRGPSQDTEDLVQEVYLQLLRFPPKEPLRETQAYLYRVAWHVANRANDKRRREALPFAPEALEQIAEQSGLVAAEDVQYQLSVQQQIGRLLAEPPPVCREVVLKFKADGLSYRQIADEFGISVHMVEKHIARAVRHLRAARWD